jgi:hypothetical protein
VVVDNRHGVAEAMVGWDIHRSRDVKGNGQHGAG